jgi:hypothetical protein
MSKLSTWELMSEAATLVGLIEEEAGVLTEATEDALAAWVSASIDKVGACVMAARRLDVEADLLKAEEERLYQRRKGMEAGRLRCREYATMLLVELEAMGEPSKVKGSNYTAWLQDSESLATPEDVAQWPLAWRKVTVAPDKGAAQEALRKGEVLPEGFSVVTKRTVRFR